VAWQFGHQRRPESRRRSTARGTSKFMTTSSMPRATTSLSRASAWFTVRGNPSSSKTVGAVGLGHALRDQGHQEGIGHEIAVVHQGGRLFAERRATGNGVPQHFPGGDASHARLSGDDRRLGSFSSARRPKEEETERALRLRISGDHESSGRDR
jgi:hypothetical protein